MGGCWTLFSLVLGRWHVPFVLLLSLLLCCMNSLGKCRLILAFVYFSIFNTIVKRVFKESMGMSSVKELQFAMHRAACSCNVKLIITLTWNGSETGNSKIHQRYQANTYSTAFRNSHGRHFNHN